MFHNSSFPKVLALSPIFSRHEIADKPHGGYDINLNTNTIQRADYRNTQDDPPDLRYVDYFSDGKTLNATLWLDKQFQNKPAIDKDFHYGMLIDADSNPKTGLDGADYGIDVNYNHITGKWEKQLLDYSTLYGATRTLSNEVYANFFEPLHNFVSIFVNLDAISEPNKYKVMFYTYVYYIQTGHYVADFSNWVDIPPPNYSISTSQEPLQLRPGETKTVGAQLRSNTGTVPNLAGLTTTDNSLPIKINIITDKFNNSSIKPITFDIASLNNAQVGQYTIPLLANISEGSTFLPDFIHLENYSLSKSVPTEGYMLAPVNLTINVLEPLTFEQSFKEAWETYGSLITLIGGGFAAGGASLIFDRLRSAHRKNGTNIDRQ